MLNSMTFSVTKEQELEILDKFRKEYFRVKRDLISKFPDMDTDDINVWAKLESMLEDTPT